METLVCGLPDAAPLPSTFFTMSIPSITAQHRH